MTDAREEERGRDDSRSSGGAPVDEAGVIFGSVCSGIEAASVAWHPLGWRAAWYAEIDQFACALLREHFPETPNLGDITDATFEERASAIDLLVGGTPCQAFSVAGQRAGMDDARGQLTHRFLEIAGRLRPRWLVWENVPGVLSIDGGRVFGAVLGRMVELGYGIAYRVLDAQHFGVPQRRRRVFVVGYLGDWRRAAAVLFERDCLSGNPAPRRAEREDVAQSLGGGPGARGWCDDLDRSGAFVPQFLDGTLRADGFDASEDGTGRGTPLIAIQSVQGVRDKKQNGIGIRDDGGMFTLTGRDQHAIAFHVTQDPISGDVSPAMGAGNAQGCGTVGVVYSMRSAPRKGRALTPSPDAAGHVRLRDPGFTVEEERAPTLDSGVAHIVAETSIVRRLTPRECERLQGLPDDWTLITYRGKPSSDGPRYRAVGNSMAVPVMRWLGDRIQMVEEAAR